MTSRWSESQGRLHWSGLKSLLWGSRRFCGEAGSPSDSLQHMDYTKVIAYRKKSQSAREEFLEHLATLQEKHNTLVGTANYEAAITYLVKTEIVPAARAFRNKLEAIDDSLYGSLAEGAITGIGASAALSIFGDMSWGRPVALGSGIAVYLGKTIIDDYIAQHALKRECAISYVLSLYE